MNGNRNQYGYPMMERAQAIAAEARARLASVPCTCAECIKASNLPAVQRILAKWKMK